MITAYNSAGSIPFGNARKHYCGLILYRNNIPIFYARVAASNVITNEANVYYGAIALPTFIDDASTGSTTYKLRIGFSTPITDCGIQVTPWESYGALVRSASLSVVELKK